MLNGKPTTPARTALKAYREKRRASLDLVVAAAEQAGMKLDRGELSRVERRLRPISASYARALAAVYGVTEAYVRRLAAQDAA